MCGQVGLQGETAFLKMRFAVVQSTPALLCALRVSVEFCGLGIRNGFIDGLEGTLRTVGATLDPIVFVGPQRASALNVYSGLPDL